MAKMGCVCAFTLSILTSGYQLEWDEAKGPAPPTQLRNHPSALADAAFTSSAVQAGVNTGVIRQCARSDLKCVLPLAVAVNHALKKRLIWDGRHVNKHLVQVPFKMETLQSEGRTLFGGCSWGGTFDISTAYTSTCMWIRYPIWVSNGLESSSCSWCFRSVYPRPHVSSLR